MRCSCVLHGMGGLGVLALECLLCPSGYHQRDNKSASCLPCIPGKASNLTGQLECTACAENTYADEPEATVCLDCEAGRTATNGSAVCSACTAGTRQRRAAEMCAALRGSWVEIRGHEVEMCARQVSLSPFERHIKSSQVQRCVH